jgi:hypothetical protein
LGKLLEGKSRWREALPLYEKAAEIYSDLRSKGSLTAELVDEHRRIEAARAAARSAMAARSR